jgi:HD-GYP domain-containing protein (c-di-GMP phosphodiesterase class II)
MEILDLMGSRLELPGPLLQTFKRAARLRDLFRIYLCNHASKKDRPSHKHCRDQEEVEDYALILDQFTRLFNFFASEWTILRYHREYYDGSGHPEGLDGNQIPMGSRLLALVNAFVTITKDIKTDQPSALTPGKAIEELVKGAGHKFDPLLVSLLLDIIEEKKLLNVPKELLIAAKKKL